MPKRLPRLMREAPVAEQRKSELRSESARSLLRRDQEHADRQRAGDCSAFRLRTFARRLALLITTMASIYTGLAAVIAFGVVYNSARISLSERARELASLRVLGFTPGEVLRILLLELALLTLIAQPPGWVMGYGLAWIMQTQPRRRIDAGAAGR